MKEIKLTEEQTVATVDITSWGRDCGDWRQGHQQQKGIGHPEFGLQLEVEELVVTSCDSSSQDQLC